MLSQMPHRSQDRTIHRERQERRALIREKACNDTDTHHLSLLWSTACLLIPFQPQPSDTKTLAKAHDFNVIQLEEHAFCVPCKCLNFV